MLFIMCIVLRFVVSLSSLTLLRYGKLLLHQNILHFNIYPNRP
jgi:hypothetical protein